MARTATSPLSTQSFPASEGAGTITIDVAAKLLMVTPEWVRRLTKDGWIAKTERGRYRVVDVVQGYIRFLKDEARRATKTASHTRLQEIRARKEELAVAQTERELVPLVGCPRSPRRGGMAPGAYTPPRTRRSSERAALSVAPAGPQGDAGGSARNG